MALPWQPGLVILLLLLLWGCWSSPVPLTPCPEACVCLDHTLINCSSSGLPLTPRHPSMDRTTDLDLSHNLLSTVALRMPNTELRALRLGNNHISYLSLCLDKRSSDGGGHTMRSPGAWRNQRSPRCASWAPSLLLLSMEKNRLAETPRGLGGSRALQVLQLSYNQISTLEAGDLEGLQQLKELHLHHNLISSLHPRAFIGLTNLTVIDLSFNLLTSLSPATFWSLRVGLEVRGGGNLWRCDCDMASMKRRMALDEDEDQRLWLDMVCYSPSSLAGRDLLQLHEEDLGCPGAQNRPGLHQDLTVDHGSTVLLPCSMQKGSTWWTPKGEVSANESQTDLLISDITERDAGLYICLSQSHQDVVTVYHLKIREIGGVQARANSRLPRSLPVDTRGISGAYIKSSQVTENQLLGLAVGLSVFFTFLVAFILGVFARPCIDVLWQKVCGKKNTSSQPGSVSSAGQGPYDNQAYLDEEDNPEIVSDRERRVTFSTQENQEQSSMYNNVTLASGHPQNLPHTRHHSGEACGRYRLDDRGIAANSEPTLSQEFEHIPEDNELGEQRSLSSSSNEEQGNSTRTKKKSLKASSSQPMHDSVHQKKTDLDLTSEPFADWSPHLNDTRLTDQDQSNDSGEAFDFESTESGSARSSSLSGSFNHSKKIVFPPSNDLRQSDRSSSSSSSHLSGDESTLYTVNQDTKEWEGIEMNQDVQNINDTEGELQNAKMAPDHFDSSHSSSCESDDEVTEYTFIQGAADEDEGTGRISKNIDAQNNIWPKLDFSNVTRIKQRLDITVETDTTGPAVTLKDTDSDYTTHVKPHPDIEASTDSTFSSSESEEETKGPAINLDDTYVKTKMENAYQQHLCLGTVNPYKDFEINAHENRWPELDFNNITGTKRHLDIKVVTETTGLAGTLKDADQAYRYHVNPLSEIKESTDFTSSSSVSEDQPNLYLGTKSPIKDFEINAREDRWPELNLCNINRVKRRLDIKATTDTRHPAVTLKNTDQDYRWSQLDIGNQVKQPVDIKASTDSTSSSDSDEEPSDVRAKIEKTSPLKAHLGTVGQNKEFEMNVQNESWPLVDLSRVTGVKRRLAIKVATETTGPAVTLKDTDQNYRYNVKPRPDITASTDSTSSSSDSEEDTMGPVVNLDDIHVKTKVETAYQPNLHLGIVSPIKDSKINAQENRWPKLNLSNIFGIKQRLDIKVATPSPDVTSSIGERGEDDRWPKMDLNNVAGIKRRLDIKVKPHPEIKESTDFTSSSSESEEDYTVVNIDNAYVKTKVENAYQPKLHLGTVSPIKDFEINAQVDRWPELDLGNVNRLKRRLDIKATSEPAVLLKDTAQDYRWSQLDLGNVSHAKRTGGIKALTDVPSSSNNGDEEPTDVRTKIGMVSPPIVHLGTVDPNKESEIKVQKENWPLVDLSRVTGVKRCLDIKVATETIGHALTLKDTDQDNRYHVKPHREASTDFISSSSDSEEETRGPAMNVDYTKTKGENAYQPPLHLGTVKPIKDTETNAKNDKWPELDLSRLPHIKRRLDFKASSEEETMGPVVNLDHTNVKTKVEQTYQPHLHLGTVKPTNDFEIHAREDGWPGLDLGNVTGIKRRLDIKVATETTGPVVTLKDTDQDYMYHVKPHPDFKASTYFTSSSSDSEEETRGPAMNVDYTKTKGENAYQPPLHLGTVKPIKDTETNAKNDKWPELDLSRLPHIKRRLDFKASSEEETMGPVVNLDHTNVKTKVEQTYQPHLHLGTVKPTNDFEIHAREDGWPGLDLGNVTGIKRRLDIKVATETTGPVVTLKDTDQDYMYHVKPHPDFKASTYFTSSSSDSEEETRGPAMNVDYTKTKGENAYQPPLHLGTVKPIKDTETNAKNDKWPELDLSRLPHIKRRLDFKASSEEETMGPVVNLDHTNVKTKVEQTYQPHLHLGTVKPTNDFEIHAREDGWPGLDLGNVTGIKRRLDIKVATETTGPVVTLKDTDQDYMYHVKPHPDFKASTYFTSSSSDSEEETRGPAMNVDYTKTKGENAYQPPLHLGTVKPIKDTETNAKNDKWPELDLSRLPHIKRRLDFKASSEEETMGPVVNLDHTNVKTKVEQTYQPHLHLGTVKPTNDFEIHAREDGWPGLDLGNVTGIKRRLDIKVATETTGRVVTLKDTDQDYMYHVKPHPDFKASTYFTSSSSDSEEETRGPAMNVDYTKTKGENAYQPPLHLGTVKPIKDTETNAKNDKWPELDLSRLPHIKRRLDFKASTKTPSSAVTLDDTDDDRWSHLDLDNITLLKRRLDIKVPTPLLERTSSDSRVPLQSHFSSSSNDSESEVKVQMIKQEREDPVVGTMSQIRWPDLNPRVSRIKRRIDFKTPLPIPHPGKVDPVPVQNDTGSSTSESEDEKLVHTRQHERESILHFNGPLYDNSLTSKGDPMIKLEKYAVITDGLDDNTTGPKSIPGPEVTPDLESRWAGLNLGMSRLRKRLDISKATPLKVSSETEIWSSSGERVNKSKEWAEKISTVKESNINAQKETWPLVDLGNVTGVKRRLDIKVATPSPYIASSSGESGEADSWPVLDLDNVTGIKRRLDIKATLSSNTSDISIEDRWKMKSRDVQALLESPPPVPDCPPPDSSPSSESEDDSTRENKRTDFPEYRTHGPARSFAPSVRGTSDTEVASSFKTGDVKGWSSVMVDTQERRGLGALRAMSSERKRWDTDHEELGAKWSSQQNSFQGFPLREAPSLNYSCSGKDLEPHTSITSVQEARAPGRLPRSVQRAEYQNRLMGHYGQGEDTKVDLRHPPEYLELQNSTLLDLSNPMTEV